MNEMQDFAALVGIDWADKKHDIALWIKGEKKIEHRTILHNPGALEEWARELEKRFPGQQIAVCLEQTRGPLVYALLKYPFLVLFPINPKSLWNFRKAFTPSGAKNDLRDSALLLEFLQKHFEKLTPLRPSDEKTRLLLHLVENRRKLVNDRKRLQNRLTALLKGYFPQALSLFSHIGTEIVCDFLLKYPSLEKAKKVSPETLIEFFEEHHSRGKERNDKRVTVIAEASPLTHDKAVITSSILMVTALCRELRQLIESISLFDSEIEKICAVHQDFALFDSFPGAATNFASRMVVAFGTDRNRFSRPEELLTLSGIAPITSQSGNSEIVSWRLFCPKFLRQTFHEYAGQSIKHSFWAKAYYQQQLARGKSSHAAKRALTYKWIRIMFRCWKNRTPYNEVRYLEALKKKSSPLLPYAASAPSVI